MTKDEAKQKIMNLFMWVCDDDRFRVSNSNTYQFGLTDLSVDDNLETLNVTCRKPSILIGKAGHNIFAIENHLEVKINIIEKVFEKY